MMLSLVHLTLFTYRENCFTTLPDERLTFMMSSRSSQTDLRLAIVPRTFLGSKS